MNEQEMRNEFEKTINIHCRTRNEHGDYIMGETQDAWSGFQRGYEAAQQRILTEQAEKPEPELLDFTGKQTLRDQFAMSALICTDYYEQPCDSIAQRAYAIADAMMEARCNG